MACCPRGERGAARVEVAGQCSTRWPEAGASCRTTCPPASRHRNRDQGRAASGVQAARSVNLGQGLMLLGESRQVARYGGRRWPEAGASCRTTCLPACRHRNRAQGSADSFLRVLHRPSRGDHLLLRRCRLPRDTAASCLQPVHPRKLGLRLQVPDYYLDSLTGVDGRHASSRAGRATPRSSATRGAHC